jgi:hypothetical protein
MTKRAVRHHRQPVLLAPGNDRIFHGAFLQVIQDLITDEVALFRHLPCFHEIRYVEVADSPREDHPIGSELLKARGCSRWSERDDIEVVPSACAPLSKLEQNGQNDPSCA